MQTPQQSPELGPDAHPAGNSAPSREHTHTERTSTMAPHSASGLQRWQRGFSVWLAFTMLVGALMAPLFLAGPAAAKPGGGQHGRAHHGDSRDGGKHHGGKHKGDKHKGDKRKGGTHCVAELIAGSGELQNESCYRTFTQAMAAATGGRVQLSADVRPEDVTEKDLAQGQRSGVEPRAYNQAVLGIFFDKKSYDYSGATYTIWFNDANGCSDGSTHSISTMPRVGTFSWDNRLSSAKTFSGCKATYYWGTNFQGGGFTNREDTSSFGLKDNATSSIRWSRA
jgi:hypothetical protein